MEYPDYQDCPATKETLAHGVFSVLRENLDSLLTKDRKVNRVFRAFEVPPATMAWTV